MSEIPTPKPNDVDALFDHLIAGHDAPLIIKGNVEGPEEVPTMNLAVVLEDGTIEKDWSALDASKDKVYVKKEAFSEDGEPVNYVMRIDADVFDETQAVVEMINVRSSRIAPALAKRALMVHDVMETKRRETYPHNHRYDLDVIAADAEAQK